MIARLSALATGTGNARRVLIGAGVAFLIAAAFGAPVTTILKSSNTDFQNPTAENQQVEKTIERATGQRAAFGVAALVPSAGEVRTNRAAQLEAAHVASMLAAQPGFQRVIDYPATHLAALVSRDGRQTVVLAAFSTQERSAAAVARLRPELAGQDVRFGGPDVAFSEINKRTSSDLKNAELLAFPILLLLSLWVFRGLIAAALPLLVGGFAIVLTFLFLRLINAEVTGLSIFAVNLVTGMGLGLGIDYSLFVLSRYREELAGGADTVRGHQTHDADRRSYRAVQLADRRRGARFAARLPAAVPVLDGHRRHGRRPVGWIRRSGRAAGRARRARAAGQLARPGLAAAQCRPLRAGERTRRLVSPRSRA